MPYWSDLSQRASVGLPKAALRSPATRLPHTPTPSSRLLAEIATLSKVNAVRMKVLVKQVVHYGLTGEIDYEKVRCTGCAAAATAAAGTTIAAAATNANATHPWRPRSPR